MRLKKNGFTLVELLVVITIIVILSGIMYVSFGSSRAKSRDAKRVADLNNIALSLELFYNKNHAYPSDIYASSPEGLSPDFMSKMPFDTNGTSQYSYVSNTTGSCYHLAVTLENPSPNDKAGKNGSFCATGGLDGTQSKVYDIVPSF